jgi:ribonuclease BN (tRNA processing enzyme)
MSGVTFTILGSSSGFPQADRASSGYVVSCGDALTLLDCGGGVTSAFLRAGFDPLAVDRIVISHTHPDHCCEIPLFIQLEHLAGRVRPLVVLVPEEFVGPLRAYLPSVYIIGERFGFDLTIVGYAAGMTAEEPLRITAYPNRHLEGYAADIERLGLPNGMQCSSLAVEAEGARIVYSADLSSFGDLRPVLQAGDDLVVVESTHIDMAEFLSFAGSNPQTTFVLTHLGDPRAVDELRVRIDKIGLENVQLAEDGQQYVVVA